MGSIEQPSMATRYVVKKMKTRSEMDAIMDVIWSANYDPYEPFAQLFFPVLGFTQSAWDTAVAESKSRFWENHIRTPTSTWYYVQEVASGKVVGCAEWEEHSENPFKNGPPTIQAPWWPEGDYREFCESIIRQTYSPRTRWMQRPHMALNWMAVLPPYRRQGIGSLLMSIGTLRADELGVECWMEASTLGKPLYDNHGFRSLFKMQFDTERKNPSDVWRRCAHEMTPTAFFTMWRPKDGRWEYSGQSVKLPWERGIA